MPSVGMLTHRHNATRDCLQGALSHRNAEHGKLCGQSGLRPNASPRKVRWRLHPFYAGFCTPSMPPPIFTQMPMSFCTQGYLSSYLASLTLRALIQQKGLLNLLPASAASSPQAVAVP